jgi:hypothetical protein
MLVKWGCDLADAEKVEAYVDASRGRTLIREIWIRGLRQPWRRYCLYGSAIAI